MQRPTLCLIATLLPLPAAAQSPIAEVICAPRADMTARLTRDHRAERHATGIRSPEELVEVWRAEDGDWTLVITYASGRSCIVAMGARWALEDPPA